ncbi:MAG: ATP-binding cassette domain-containing protein [Planctomycetota bacterium]|nr:ATP-binding cassette domain-containing protein [Planctomycetota bacterium]
MSEDAIRLIGLSYAYPDGTRALDGVDLRIGEGEKVGLVGPNGAGKSTLLLHLNAILRGDGSVKIFGLETGPPNLKEIRRRVGLVFQDPDDQLFMPTVFEDVAFGPLQMGLPEDEVKGRVEEALGRVRLGGYEDKAPHHLSDGEKRGVAIATVLSMDPRMLVLDEPTSNLDPRGRRSLIRILMNLPQTQLIATHDLDLILEVCERCVVLDGGVVVADGRSVAILSDRDLMEGHGLEVPHSIHHLNTGEH